MSSVVASRELLLPLVEGIHESPPWRDFLRHLVARTHARRAVLLITLASASGDHDPAVVHVAAPRAATEPPLDYRRFERIGLKAYGTLRSGRVYSLEEMLDYSGAERAARQRAELAEIGARHGRLMRVSAGGAADAWLLLVREREDFTAAAVATLSGTAPVFAAALRTLVALIDERLRATMARAALAKLGIGQLAFDATGRVIAADAGADTLLAFMPETDPSAGRRLQTSSSASQAIERACARLAAGQPGGDGPILLDGQRNVWLLLQKADLPLDEPCARPAAIGMVRVPGREDPAAARRALTTLYGLSRNEAALAHQISLGRSIVEAGRSLSLTPETSRNYSKRIYAKTGAVNQADLVRLILTGIVPLT